MHRRLWTTAVPSPARSDALGLLLSARRSPGASAPLVRRASSSSSRPPQAQPQAQRRPGSAPTVEYEPEAFLDAAAGAEQTTTAADPAADAAAAGPSSTALASGRPTSEAVLADARAPAGPSLVERLQGRYDRPLTLSRGPHMDAQLPTMIEGHRAITAFELKRDFKMYGLAAALSIGLAVGGWTGFWVFCEYFGLAAPASLWEDEATAADGGDGGWGWALENDDWTGGSNGGTSSTLPLEARRQLHMAWFALFWPLGPTDAELHKQLAVVRREAETGEVAERSFLGQAVDWLKSDDAYGGLLSDGQKQLKLLPSAAIAEVYVRTAIEETLADKSTAVWLPPALESAEMPLPPAALHRPRIERPANTVGIALLLRHAALLEQMAAGDDSLERAQALVERVLRAVNGFEGAETLELQLARRLGDLARANGDPRAEAWLRWGVERATGFRPSPTDGEGDTTAAPAATRWKAQTSEDRSWWSSLWSSTRRETADASGLTSDPSSPSIGSLLAALRQAEALPPARLRALLSLIGSLSAVQSQPETLAAARETQTAALELLSTTLARLSNPSASSSSSSSAAAAAVAVAGCELHRLALERYQALFSAHLAEVLYVSPPVEATEEASVRRGPTELLETAFKQSAAISSFLAPPPSTGSSSADDDDNGGGGGGSSFPPTPAPAAAAAHDDPAPLRHPLPQTPTHRSFLPTRRPTALERPAADLLANARRTAASSANLLAFLALERRRRSRAVGEEEEGGGASLDEARRLYEAAMAFVGPLPPRSTTTTTAAAANDDDAGDGGSGSSGNGPKATPTPPTTVVFPASSTGEPESLDGQSAEWQMYYAGWRRTVDDQQQQQQQQQQEQEWQLRRRTAAAPHPAAAGGSIA